MELNQVNNNAGNVRIEVHGAAVSALPEFHVLLRFGAGIPSAAQGATMLALERTLREMGIPAECFKETMADDLKSRREMTAYERANL